MIRCFGLQNKKVIDVTLDNMDLIWVDLTNPSDEEIRIISTQFRINFDDMKDCIDLTERPRHNVDLLLKNQLLLLHSSQNFEIDMTQAPTFPFGLFLTESCKIVTIHILNGVYNERLVSKIKSSDFETSWSVYLSLIQILLIRLDKIAISISNKIQEFQGMMLKSSNVKDIQEPFNLNTFVILYNTSMLGNLSAIKAFIVKNKAFLEQNIIMLERIDDIQTDMSQVCEYTNIYRDLLANSLDAFASVLNNNISDVMKIVGSISLILMIPTLIASFYGMNVSIPGGNGEAAWSFILLVSFGLSLFCWFIFRKMRWL